MALYELVLRQQVNAQEVINRWNYTSTGTPVGVSGSFGLVSAAGGVLTGSPGDFPSGTLMAAIKGQQASDVIFVELAGINVYDPDDFFTIAWPSGLFGGVSGSSTALFIASGFRTNRVTRAVRRGFKRIAGVPTGAVGEFGAISSGQLALMVTTAARMTDVLNYTDGGNSLAFTPAIVKKLLYTTPAGNPAYMYFATLAEQITHLASGVTWEGYANARSQGSRQLGRGA